MHVSQDKTSSGEKWDCFRRDSLNLAEKWLEARPEDPKSRIVRSASQLQSVNAEETDYLLGLFGQSHMEWDHQRTTEDPSLSDMTSKALEVSFIVQLRKNTLLAKRFLFNEGYYRCKIAAKRPLKPNKKATTHSSI